MKRRILVLTSLIYIACLLQSTVVDFIEIAGIRPNLLIVGAVAIALCRRDMESAYMGLFFGLAMDILVGRALGWYAMLLFLVCFCIGMLNPKLYKDNLLVPIFFVFVSSISVEMMIYFIYSFLKGYPDMIFVLTSLIFPESIYNALLAIPIYPLVVRIYKKLDKYDYVHARL